MPRRALAPGARQGEFMTTILTAYTLSECMELMAERAAAVEKTGGKNLIFCEDRLTLIAERALVAATGGTFSSSVTTFARYLGADGRILSKQGSVMAVGGIMAELQRRGALKCFTSASGIAGEAKSVYETIAQMAASEITEDTLRESLENLPDDLLKNKLADLAAIYGEYLSYLREKGFADESRYLSLLPGRIRTDKEIGGTTVFFLCYDSLTRQAAEAVRAAAERAAGVVGVFCAGKEAIYCNRAADAFSRAAEEGGRLRRRNCGVPLGGEAEVLRTGLFEPERLNGEARGTDRVHIAEIKDKSGEAEYIAANIRQRIAENPDLRWRDFAVLVSSGAAYSLPLKKAFDEYGIPYFFDEKKSLKRHPLGRFLLSCFDVVREGFSPDSVQALAANYFFGGSDIYRNYLLKFANYRGGAKREIRSGDVVKDYTEEELEGCRRCRERLLTATKNIKRKGQGRDHCNAVRKILADFDAETQLETLSSALEDAAEKGYLGQISSALERLLSEADSVTGDREMTAAEFEAILSDGLDATDISLIPLKADAVFVGDIADSRIEKVRVLFAAGMTDDVPRRADDTALISDREIERLAEVRTMLEPTIAEVNLRAREAVCLNLCTFTDELFLSYPLAADGSEPALSEILRYVNGLFCEKGGKKLPVERAASFPYRCSARVPAIRELLLNRRAFEKGQGDTRREYSSLYAALEELSVREKDDYLQKWDGQVRVQCGEELFFREGRISPTKLESYFSCPFCNFAKNGLRLKDRDETIVMAVDSGNFIHKLLEQTAGAIAGLDTEEKARGYARATGEKLLQDPLYVAQSDTVSGQYASRNLLREGEEAAAAVWRQITGSAFRVEKTESSVDAGIFRGKVDRVDGTDKYVRVIDYKTGSIDDSPVSYYTGRKLQLELYMSAVCGEREPAGVFYFPASLAYTDGEEVKFRMLGFLNGDEEALRSGDLALSEGKVSDFFGAGMNNSRRPKVMDGETFADFLRYAAFVSERGVEELKGGFIAPSPYKDECKYCKYGGLCGFNYDLAEPRYEEKITPKAIAGIARREEEERKNRKRTEEENGGK